MRIVSRIVLGAAAAVSFAGAAQAQTFTNGGFESPSITPNQFSVFTAGTDTADDINGWTVISRDGRTSSVDLVARPTYGTNTGNQALDLLGTGTATGAIAQTFTSVANQVYKLTFSYSANSGCGAAGCTAGFSANATNARAPLAFRVGSAPGAAAAGQTFSAVGGAAYVTQTAFFTASSAATTLSFFDISGNGNSGIFLDDVSVQAVPELATWAMMIIGFGMVGSVIRRRRVTFRPTLANA
jgi:hypothetical protein